jgi:hypothetical protein
MQPIAQYTVGTGGGFFRFGLGQPQIVFGGGGAVMRSHLVAGRRFGHRHALLRAPMILFRAAQMT